MSPARAAILAIGDELTLGQSLDTNSAWLAERLVGLGAVPVEHDTVPDELEAIVEAIRRLAARADVLIVTGGLGPTPDDLTRGAVGAVLGEPLEEDPEALARLEAYFARLGRRMPPANRVQACRPASSESIPNEAGTAPGLHATVGGCEVFCLPGPPREMSAMFERRVAPRLGPAGGRAVRTRALHTIGLGESELADRLGPILDRARDPLVGTTVSGPVVTCRLRSERSGTPEAADRALDETERAIRDRLGAHVFGADADTLASAVVRALAARGQTLAVVESCTGGLLGSMITDVPGASGVFLAGWITYANEAKRRDVGVPARILEHGGPGAVGRACALAMAEGGVMRAGARHALAITGIAGPDGGTPDKPVGTVWIARASAGSASGSGHSEARRFRFSGSRADVRTWAALSALAVLWLHVAGADGTRLLRQVEPAP